MMSDDAAGFDPDRTAGTRAVKSRPEPWRPVTEAEEAALSKEELRRAIWRAEKDRERRGFEARQESRAQMRMHEEAELRGYLGGYDGRGGYEPGRYKSDEQLAEERYRWRKADAKAVDRVAEEQAAKFSPVLVGRGENYSPDRPRALPCVLEYATGAYAFAPGISCVFGPPESGKTWLTYLAALQEARNGGQALILDYELLSEDEARDRLHDLGATREEQGRIVYMQFPGLPSDADREKLLAVFAPFAPTAVVLDSVGMSMGSAGLDSDKGRDTERWAFNLPLWLKRTWPDTAVLLIDHVRKGENGATAPVGSQRKSAYADAMFSMSVMEDASLGHRGKSRLTAQKDRKGHRRKGDPVLDFEFGGGGLFELSAPDLSETVIDLSGGEAAAGYAEQVYADLRAAGRQGIAKTALTGSGSEGKARRDAFDRLVSEGRAAAVQDGRFTRCYADEFAPE